MKLNSVYSLLLDRTTPTNELARVVGSKPDNQCINLLWRPIERRLCIITMQTRKGVVK